MNLKLMKIMRYHEPKIFEAGEESQLPALKQEEWFHGLIIPNN